MNLLRDAGHRRGVKWALENWALDPITCTAIVGGQMNGYRTTHPQGSTYLRETNDPNQIAGMLEFEAKRCGVGIHDNNDKPITILVFWFAETNGQLVRKAFDLAQACSVIAKLICLPDGGSITARRVLRGSK